MLTYIRKIMKNDKGFTLIELMVVVVILGILAAIAIPQFTKNSDSAKLNAAYADIKVLQNAVDLFYFDKSVYPSDLNALVTNGYVRVVPAKDPWGGTYSYSNSTGQVTFTKP